MTPSIAYVIAECRPCTDQDEYASIAIGDDNFIFTQIEPAETIKAAMEIAIDIERTQPSHKYIVLHHQSLIQLIDGIKGDEVTYYE